MSGDLKALKQVAALDAKILELEAQQKNIPKVIEEKQKSLEAARGELKKKDTELKDLLAKNALKENELKAAEQAVIKFREQIAQAKSNKEFQALQHEILSKEADNTRLEDAVLIEMQKSDKKRGERDAIAAEIKKTEKGFADEDAALQKDLSEIGNTVQKLRKKREAVTRDVPRDILAKYQRLIQRRGHTAMVAVVDGTCQGCFMKLRPETMAQLRKGTDLVFCHSCARILYLEEEAGE
ncbi:MAG: C4-type zinc ribbon domain-containing protein [Planctomycetota bacterium]